ncbi:hypothetical protein V5799_034447 [Amblyomma americanum]|uniref:Uncharacterized protein n=1 Tax=Amblyomma americanum TaxID=6943 RepID=A0AAQ4DKF4_AMBAM
MMRRSAMCVHPSSPDRPTAQCHPTGCCLHFARGDDLGQGAECCRERRRNIATRVTRPAGKPPVAEVAKRFVASVRRLTLTIGNQGPDYYHHHDYRKGRLGSEKRVCENAACLAQPSAVPPATGTRSKTSTSAPLIAACAVQSPQAAAQAANPWPRRSICGSKVGVRLRSCPAAASLPCGVRHGRMGRRHTWF